jgi:ABC-type lipoprotein release transport system permease subunit
MNNEDLHLWLSSKAALFVSWVSAFLGLGTAIGVVNLLVGVLSACWLTAQLINHFVYVVPKHKREAAEWEAREAARKSLK